MPFVEMTQEVLNPARRVLLVGGPNTHKTTSLRSWPRPSVVISAPGEKGWETLRNPGEGLTAKVWQVESPDSVVASSVVREVESESWKALATPGLQTFAVDGLHKLYAWYYKQARTKLNGALLLGKDITDGPALEQRRDLAAYGNETGGAYADFMLYLTKVLSSPVPYVVMTCWIEPEPDEAVGMKLDGGGGKVTTHDFPSLPGKLAKRIVGEFGAVLACEVDIPDLKGNVKGRWQLRKEGKVWGVGIKAQPELAKTLPTKMDQDFAKFEQLLKGEGAK